MPASRVVRAGRRLLTAAVCALAAHALLYRSLWPGDGVHGYLGWYEPLVAALSGAAVLGLALAVAVQALRGRPVARALAGLAGAGTTGGAAREIAVGGLALLLVQESAERAVELGQPAVVQLTPGQWLVLLAGIGAASAAIAFALRAGKAVVRRVLAGGSTRAGGEAAVGSWVVVCASRPRPRPLAAGCALRGPPLTAG